MHRRMKSSCEAVPRNNHITRNQFIFLKIKGAIFYVRLLVVSTLVEFIHFDHFWITIMASAAAISNHSMCRFKKPV
jgi:hypothetical protein